MKIIFTVTFLLLFVIACRQNNQQHKGDTIIAAGQMPAIAKDDDNNLHLVFGRGDSLMYSTSTDNGYTFSEPVLINVLPHVYTYATRGPQIAATREGLVVTACTTEGNIYSFRKPEGSNWQPAQRVNDKDTVCKEGLMSLSAFDSHLSAVWLDGREKGKIQLYEANSTDGGNTWSRNISIYTSPDSTICECCKPSVVVWKNKVAVMFRNWLHGNRDLYLVQSDDGGNTFGSAEKLGNGSWQLNGCPMDGGSLIINKSGGIQTVWRRETTIYTNEPGAAEQSLGEGRSCTLEAVNNATVYAWVEKGNIMVRKPDGANEQAGAGMLPQLKAIDDTHVLCLWENDKQIHTSVLQL